jgi:hypothetical protein
MLGTHLLLCYGDSERLEALHTQHRFSFGADATGDPVEDQGHYHPVREPTTADEGDLLLADELVSRFRGKQIVVYTGAGLSLASGIPTFVGEGSLSDTIPLIEPFPGEVSTWMIECPAELATILGKFQASFITAQPSAGHMALVQLEQSGVLRQIITGNGDLLHEKAGSRKVRYKNRAYFVDSEDGWGWIREGETLLVVGVARDEHGIISFARDNHIQIAAIAPDRPNFLCEGDWFVQGRAEDVLSLLEVELTK